MTIPTSIRYFALTPDDNQSVAIMQIIDDADIDTCISKFAATHWQPKAIREISFDDIPKSRIFRDAWRDTGISIEHDMNAVKAIHLGRILQARIPVLEALDIEYMKADEQGDIATKTAIATQKQILRDLSTFDLSSAKTPDEVLALWPVELGQDPYVMPEAKLSRFQKLRHFFGIGDT